MTDRHLCVQCSFMDRVSQNKWDKALEAWRIGVDPDAAQTAPTFDHYKPHCTHQRARRQAVTDPVCGTHLDGPPYLRCMEVRKTQPVTCRDYKERENGTGD